MFRLWQTNSKSKPKQNNMKKTFLYTLVLIFFFLISNAQPQPVGHLTVFSEDGDKFFLILNGERQNDKPQTNMRVEDLTQPQYSAKIIFEDKTLEEISKTLYLNDANGTLMDVTYKIKHDKNGKPKLGSFPFSAVPVRQGYVAPSNVYVVRSGAPATTTVVTTPGTTVTQTTTTQTTGGAVGANVNVGGVNMNVTVTDPLLNTNVTTTHTTTTTNYHQTEVHEQATPVGCVGAYPMNGSDFSSAVATVKNQGFDETRLKTAKQIAGGNCLSTGQIAEICKVFGFEETKLDFAKFAYDHCTEPKNYFKLNNIFSFSSSVDDLTDYVSKK